ncbi:hypothetical protein SLS57_004799 [Botryosphaeria dothidea]
MASLPSAFMAFLLLLLLGVQVNGQVASCDTICLNANATECHAPANEYIQALCCPTERPICATILGNTGCYAPDQVPTIIARRDATETDKGPSLIGMTASFVTGSLGPITGATGAFTIYPSSSSSASTSPREVSTVVSSPVDTSTGGYPYSTISLFWGSSSTVSTSTTTVRTPVTSTSTLMVTTTTFNNSSAQVSSTPIVSSAMDNSTAVLATSITTVYLSTRNHISTVVTFVSMSDAGSSIPTPTFQARGPAPAKSSDPVFTQYPWPTFPFTPEPFTPEPTVIVTITVSQPAYTHAERGEAVTSISIASDDVAIVTATGVSTTFPLALITDSTAAIPTSCQRYISRSIQGNTSVWLTYVARDCTGDPTTPGSDTTIFATSTSTSIAPSTSTESYTHCFLSSHIDACDSLFPPRATSSTTSTPTTSVPSTVAGLAAGESSLSFDLAPSQTNASADTSNDACAGASTVYITVSATPATSTYTSWIMQTTNIGSTSSSMVIVSGASSNPSTSSLVVVSGATSDGSTSVESNTSADPASTGDIGSMTMGNSSTIALPTTPPATPIIPTTPVTPVTPGSPSPTVFNGGAAAVQGGNFSGLLAIITLVLVFFQ